MANVRDSDTSLWLHNKLGTSNDSWISGSICSQLNKEVLRNIKECFPDLQTQVKLKLLLSFFHIPRRLVEEWKVELEEVIEVAGLDTELWVSMLAETMKTFPATSSLNTEISDYEDTRPIFTDMVNDLRKLVSKHSDLGMLPLECQYLNKNALVSVVGQQQNPVKHFTLKRKPKSANLRTELLHKSADAQSSLKKASAPTIPLRSRGMPRKMTDTTPLKGIPSRVPTSGFRSPNVSANQQRPNLSRTPAGRKDGGIKLIEFTDQPLGYAAAKKRKRQQELEEQQKKQEQKQNAVAANSSSSPTASPTISSGTAAASGTPTTPTSANSSFEIKTELSLNRNQNAAADDTMIDSKDDISLTSAGIKKDLSTSEYQPTLTYAQQPTLDSDLLEDSKAHTKMAIAASNNIASALPKVTTITALPNNTHATPTKKIKQEIEIKSEEILVPASIKVEKIDSQSSTQIHKSQLQQTVTQRIQQHVVIQQPTQQQQQQQQQAQHVVIRSAPQQQKPTIVGSGVTMTPTQRAPGTIKLENLDIKPLLKSSNSQEISGQSTTLTQQQLRQAANPLANLPNNISVKITSTKATKQQQQQQHTQSQQQQPILINSSTPVILASPNQTIRKLSSISNSTPTTPTTQTIKSMPLSQLKTAANSGPVIISQTIIQPAKRAASNNASTQLQPSTVTPAVSQQTQQQQQQPTTQYILTSSTAQQQSQQSSAMPSLTSFAQVRSTQQSALYQTASTSTGASTQTPTKIVLKTPPTSTVMMTPVRQQVAGVGNPPPLVSTSSGTQQGTMLNIQNVQLPNRQVTIQPASHAAQQQHLQAQLQQQQQQHPHPQPHLQHQQQQQHTVVSNTTTTQQPKLTQVVMQSAPNAGGVAGNVKNKTIILTQKGVILRNIGGDMYQQIPISNVSGLQNIGSGTTLMTTAAGPPGLVKTTSTNLQPQQTIQIQQQQPTATTTLVKQQLPTLIPTNNMSTVTQQHVLVQQPQQQQTMQTIIGNPTQQTIIRPVMTNVQSGLTTLPQGLTLIQRPGQQPQFVQVQAAPSGQQQTQIHRTIITQPQQQQKIGGLQQMRPQQIILQHKAPQQRIITPSSTASTMTGQPQQIQIQQNNAGLARGTQIIQVQQQQQTQQQQQIPQRKGLSLSNEHVHKAHEMFRKANRVSRPDKALILGFMAGLRENPRPTPENVIVIKLGDTEEKVQQEDGSTALCSVESLIRLDYNTGEWKTFQNYRRLDQNSQGQSADGSAVMQAHNSVVI